ncbi:hypothetical protein RF11_10529 [Thelohanellus kitauei]|uniref:Uncharacterized protein n=1 Tax=Thelohanellus kitauei TaxID=669202 RepID=A0A0C2M0Y6_THEKT|nr:hypothetical protein RF11_10529 [Thelohanellus kitauei]
MYDIRNYFHGIVEFELNKSCRFLRIAENVIIPLTLNKYERVKVIDCVDSLEGQDFDRSQCRKRAISAHQFTPRNTFKYFAVYLKCIYYFVSFDFAALVDVLYSINSTFSQTGSMLFFIVKQGTCPIKNIQYLHSISHHVFEWNDQDNIELKVSFNRPDCSRAVLTFEIPKCFPIVAKLKTDKPKAKPIPKKEIDVEAVTPAFVYTDEQKKQILFGKATDNDALITYEIDSGDDDDDQDPDEDLILDS